MFWALQGNSIPNTIWTNLQTNIHASIERKYVEQFQVYSKSNMIYFHFNSSLLSYHWWEKSLFKNQRKILIFKCIFSRQTVKL